MTEKIIKLTFNTTSDTSIFDFNAVDDSLKGEFIDVGHLNKLDFELSAQGMTLSLADGYTLLRLTSNKRKSLGFNWGYSDKNSEHLAKEFARQYREARQTSGRELLPESTIKERLTALGFTKRNLTSEQMRDLRVLLSLSHGANFSVPGAGKTTVTLALNVLLGSEVDKMLIICPKSAFQSWREVIEECMSEVGVYDQFTQLLGDSRTIRHILDGNGKRFFINYELARINVNELNRFLGLNRVHLVMDESHRIKAGMSTLQGRLALSLAVRATRRDVLSGTPMPQGPLDIASQVDFLRPGAGLGQRIRIGETPSDVMSGLFVRTKKSELGLKDPLRHEIRVDMNPAQAAIYATIANDTIAQFHGRGLSPSQQIYLSRGPAIRLLQSSVYPRLLSSGSHLFPELLEAAFDEGPGPKMLKAVEICEQNALQGRKTIVWTIFRETILELSNLMSHLGAEIVSGDNPRVDSNTINSRETALKNFRNSPSSFVLIANPAAASEGLSLHRECHDAIYVDRTYNAAHFLQSIDRIHRLGLDPDVETNITVLKSRIPQGIVASNVGSIDDSIWRRLRIKVDNLQRLLNDRDLQMIALSEDDVNPQDYSDMDQDDIIDLIRELTGSSSG